MVTRILRMGLALKLWFAVPYLFLRLPISICEVFTLKRERHLFKNSELDDLVVIFYHRINLDAISFKAHPWPWGLQGARRGKVGEPFVANSGVFHSTFFLPSKLKHSLSPSRGKGNNIVLCNIRLILLTILVVRFSIPFVRKENISLNCRHRVSQRFI